ncbi:MAG TPA: hypothetical protein VGV61_16720 [Thermoanaerobaculia bacterium]|nr:hypothetical protein [Thermoanaerobaculia bacterium]
MRPAAAIASPSSRRERCATLRYLAGTEPPTLVAAAPAAARERRCWRLAGALVLAIYASAYFNQFLLDALRTRGALAPTIGGVFVVAAAAVLAYLVRSRPGPWEVALLFAGAGAYLLLLRHLDIIQERIHLLEYGAVGGLFYGALLARWPDATAAARPPWQRAPALAAILLATAAGWGDELVQGLLPNRHYDLRDVLTNAEAAALLVLVLAVRRRLRATLPARASG